MQKLGNVALYQAKVNSPGLESAGIFDTTF